MADQDLMEAIKKLADVSRRYARAKFDEKTVPLACEGVNSLTHFGLSQDHADEILLAIASLWKFNPNGRAIRFMLHFFFGHGEPIEFNMADLLTEDAGVRRRVVNVISQQVLNPRWAEHRFSGGICSRLKPRQEFYPKNGVYRSPDEFPIRQEPLDYEIEDWHYATGSLPVEWEATKLTAVHGYAGPLCGHKMGGGLIDTGMMARVRMPPKSPLGYNFNTSVPKYAVIWAVKWWKWHDTDLDGTKKRITDCVHKAGYRLDLSGAATNYWVYGKPCVVDLTTGNPIKLG